MTSFQKQQVANDSDRQHATAGWKWSELSWRRRFLLFGWVIVGTALVLGIIIVRSKMGERSLLGRSLSALFFLLVLGPIHTIIGVAAGSKRQKEKAQKAAGYRNPKALPHAVAGAILIGAVAVFIGVLYVASKMVH